MNSVLPKPLWLENSSFFFRDFYCKLPPELRNLKPCAHTGPSRKMQINARDFTIHFKMCLCSKIFFERCNIVYPHKFLGSWKFLVSCEYLVVSRGEHWFKVASRIYEFRETAQGLHKLRGGYVAPRRSTGTISVVLYICEQHPEVVFQQDVFYPKPHNLCVTWVEEDVSSLKQLLGE